MKSVNYFVRLSLLLLGSITLISCGSDGSSGAAANTVEAEPNDTAANATLVTVGAAALSASIDNLGVDSDYFSFYVDTVGTYYLIDPSVGCNLDQMIWLYDTDGVTPLVDSHDSDTGISSELDAFNCETIAYSFAAKGTYYLRVEEWERAAEGVYGVEITKLTAAFDETEPNDTFDTANAITVGGATYTAAIGNVGLDKDYFSFVVDTTNVLYTIDPSVGCTLDQQVWLYDTDGMNALVNAQDKDNGSTGTCETITYTFAATGTYYLRVEELGRATEGVYGVEVSISSLPLR